MTAPDIRNLRLVVRHVTTIIGEALHCQAHIILPGAGGEVLPEAEALLPDSMSSEPPTVVRLDEPETGRVGLITDLQADGRRLGVLMVTRSRALPYSPTDAEVFGALSSQAALLIERSLLYEEVAAGAVLEERSRLAREIHDGLAQHLAFLKMRVAWLQRSEASVEMKQLHDIEGVLATALAEARQAISTLRADSGATTTAEALMQYVEEFGRVSSLEVELHPDEHLPEVGPKVRVELLRIVQESLNNVRKHAGATKVKVQLTSTPGHLVIRIEDNGKGFDPGRTPEGHFGVAIMRERAESVGGTFKVSSNAGKGTHVEVSAPVPNVDDRLIG
jgi:two-component system nitrate/nitrite sensor histidine kinase NarX